MISIIHPSRSRPELAYKTAMMWLTNPGCEVEYILSLDEDDEQINQYRTLFQFAVKSIIVNKNRSAIDAINEAAKISTGDILIVISDDFLCFNNWGKNIYREMQWNADWILKTDDTIQNWIITLPIMDRVYYERFGYIYHPAYKHSWSDTEMTCVAELTGCKFESDIVFKHLNGGATKIKDSVQERNDATFNDGMKLFIERKKRNFDLIEIQGRMTPNFYTQLN